MLSGTSLHRTTTDSIVGLTHSAAMYSYRLGVNYGQLAVNEPVVPVANFQRDGFMAIKNQGFRPPYQSSILPLQYKAKAYEHAEHEVFLGAALANLSEVTERESHTHARPHRGCTNMCTIFS